MTGRPLGRLRGLDGLRPISGQFVLRPSRALRGDTKRPKRRANCHRLALETRPLCRPTASAINRDPPGHANARLLNHTQSLQLLPAGPKAVSRRQRPTNSEAQRRALNTGPTRLGGRKTRPATGPLSSSLLFLPLALFHGGTIANSIPPFASGAQLLIVRGPPPSLAPAALSLPLAAQQRRPSQLTSGRSSSLVALDARPICIARTRAEAAPPEVHLCTSGGV